MRIVFAGTPAVALPTLEALRQSSHDVVGVITRPDAPRGRSRRAVPSDVGAWALDHGLRLLRPEHPRDPGFQAELAELAPDACAVVAYGALLTEDALAIPRLGWINLHFSLLPRWRGAAPVQRAIMAGDTVTGATTFRIVRALDAGPLFGTVTRTLDGTETAGELLDALAEEGAGLMVRTLDTLESTTPVPQPDNPVTLAPKLTVEEAHLDWNQPAIHLDRLIRGCSPAPGAWTTFSGGRFRVLYARPTEEHGLAPGALALERKRVLVGTATTALELLRVQPLGKGAMAGVDWGRGVREIHPTFAAAEES